MFGIISLRFFDIPYDFCKYLILRCRQTYSFFAFERGDFNFPFPSSVNNFNITFIAQIKKNNQTCLKSMVNNKWLIWVWDYINLYASTKGRYDLLISCQSALEVNEREYVNDMYCSLLIMGFTDMHVTCTSKVNDPSIGAWNARQKFWSTHAFY